MKFKIFGSLIVVVILIVLYVVFSAPDSTSTNPEESTSEVQE